jgi:dTDP-4-amino-4,6-dideoxygalactose transaminase
MNNFRKKNFSRNRNFNGRHHRRPVENVNQPLPANQELLPYSRHTLTRQDVEAVVEAMLSGTLTRGAELERFESLLAKLTHCYHAIAFSSGTAAIHASLQCLDLKAGDEVITSTLNFCAAANMVRLCGAVPVLVDCDPDSLTLSVEGARAAMTPRTRAIFANNFAGHASDLVALREICDENNLVLLDDACHGLGGRYRGHYIGNQADLTCFSFHPSKVVTTGEGGAVTTQQAEWAQRLKILRHHGIRQGFPDRPAYYQETQMLGSNYRMSELHAALGRSQLARLERHVERRRTIADFYNRNLAELPFLKLPPCQDWVEHAYHLYPIRLTEALEGRRDELFEELHGAQIGVQVHYVPLHRMPFHAHNPEAFPHAESYFQNCLSLPIYPDLSIKDLERVVETVKLCAERVMGSARVVLPSTEQPLQPGREADSAAEDEPRRERSGRGRNRGRNRDRGREQGPEHGERGAGEGMSADPQAASGEGQSLAEGGRGSAASRPDADSGERAESPRGARPSGGHRRPSGRSKSGGAQPAAEPGFAEPRSGETAGGDSATVSPGEGAAPTSPKAGRRNPRGGRGRKPTGGKGEGETQEG